MTSRALLRFSSCESLNFPSTMQHAAVISCVFISSLLHTGQFALIETKETVWAAVGDQASLSCRLTEDKDVLQITWQKVLPNGEKNLATYTKKFGSRVSAGLEEKMDFQYESLQSCSMVIRKVMEEDEGCYRCLFNTYPNGALIGWTCLKLYVLPTELHGPFITISRSNSPPGSVVTCSATGRPVPMVTLTVLHQNLSFSHYNTSRVSNTNESCWSPFLDSQTHLMVWMKTLNLMIRMKDGLSLLQWDYLWCFSVELLGFYPCCGSKRSIRTGLKSVRCLKRTTTITHVSLLTDKLASSNQQHHQRHQQHLI
ncbi:OX-2 membrane glycoprotein-like isoform X5 [Poecilia formosa]|uniref:OX-2 membrane glycoprotein-like isoform X5 n=1 Tax=Poecilia formosa TaxID=48698 RepID=UPI0007B79D68|nr:PREDICTED: OX-2 membrane glycoprotein-like isoform X5 [Poecilia formosa]